MHRQHDHADIERELLEPLRSRDLLKGQKVVPRPEGMEKMSEVLLEFVQPYMKSAKTRKAYDSLLAIAVASWNCALLDEKGSPLTIFPPPSPDLFHASCDCFYHDMHCPGPGHGPGLDS